MAQSLPRDVLNLVFSHLAHPKIETVLLGHDAAREALWARVHLAQCVRICRHWRASAEQALYRHLVVQRDRNINKLKQTLEKRVDLRKLCSILYFQSSIRDPEADVSGLIALTCNLLEYHLVDIVSKEDALKISPPCVPKSYWPPVTASLIYLQVYTSHGHTLQGTANPVSLPPNLEYLIFNGFSLNLKALPSRLRCLDLDRQSASSAVVECAHLEQVFLQSFKWREIGNLVSQSAASLTLLHCFDMRSNNREPSSAAFLLQLVSLKELVVVGDSGRFINFLPSSLEYFVWREAKLITEIKALLSKFHTPDFLPKLAIAPLLTVDKKLCRPLRRSKNFTPLRSKATEMLRERDLLADEEDWIFDENKEPL